MPSLSELAAAVLLLGLIMYSLFGGADFGGGIWTALASGPRRRQQRESLFHAIGPVWETNHVWLIFIVVVLFTAFPSAFSALFIVLLVPLVIALVGINFRGAAFAFRHFGMETGRPGVAPLARGFEIWSILTPVAMGMAVTTVAAGRLRFQNGEVVPDLWAWISPFTLLGGLVGLGICAYLAPIYMTVRTKGELQNDFRRRGMWAALVLGTLTTVQVPVAFIDAPLFAERLLSPGTVLLVASSIIFGLLTLVLLWKRIFLGAQIASAFTVALMLAGFAGALYPDIIIGELSIVEAAAPLPTLVVFFAVLPIGVVILVPSLIFLYWTFRGEPNPEKPLKRG